MTTEDRRAEIFHCFEAFGEALRGGQPDVIAEARGALMNRIEAYNLALARNPKPRASTSTDAMMTEIKRLLAETFPTHADALDVQLTDEGLRFESVDGHRGSMPPAQARALALSILARWPTTP